MRVLFLGALLLVAGCYTSGDRAADRPAPPVAPPDPRPAPGLACAPSELALAWSHGGEDFTDAYHPVSLHVAPGGALLGERAHLRARVIRMRDGQMVAPLDDLAIDATWSRAIAIDGDGGPITVRALASGEVVRAIDRLPLEDGWRASAITAFSIDGARALVLECGSSSSLERERTTFRAIELATGAETRVELAMICADAWSDGAPRIFSLDERTALVTGLREPGPSVPDGMSVPVLGIARIDLVAGTAITATPSEPTLATPRGPTPHGGERADRRILAIAAAGSEIAIAATDGMLRRLDAATLAPIAAPIPVPTFIANWDTFLPSVESPVAYSEDGSLFAHLGDESAIVLRETAGGAIVATLSLPFARRPDGGTAPVMAIAIVEDGVIAASSHGWARWACGGTVAEIVRPAGELAVRAAGPARVRLGEPFSFEVEVENATLPVARVVRIAGAGENGSLDPSVRGYAPSSGTQEVEIFVEDGVRTARTSASIEVLPAP